MNLELPEGLAEANQQFDQMYPGESVRRQPVHSVYGGAQLFKFDLFGKLGALARRSLNEYAPDAATLAKALSIPGEFAETVYSRVQEKLGREPVEDFRIDFEDGFGIRPDAEEDSAADRAADEFVKATAEKTLPPFVGIRIKPLSEELKHRSIRTLERFLNRVGKLPETFVVTLPKITVAEQVRALIDVLPREIRIEMMVETPQSLFMLSKLLEEARGRCVAAHFGAYDYMASLGISAQSQSMLHPACDFARSMMQNSLAGTGLWLSDGATTIMPLPVHRGNSLTAQQVSENRVAVHRGWKLHYDQIRHSLENGLYEGWDLHPAQFVARYAAVYTYFLEGLETSSKRLRNFVEKSKQATMVGSHFDDAATGLGLVNYFRRAVNCGAVPAGDVFGLTGLSVEELSRK